MAPREAPKALSKVQRMITKTIATQRTKSPVAIVKKSITSKKTPDKVLRAAKDNNLTLQSRRRASTVPPSLTNSSMTPRPKEKKTIQPPGSVSKSAKKETWKRRPKPAHSGVPVPEKLKKLLEKQLQDCNSSLDL